MIKLSTYGRFMSVEQVSHVLSLEQDKIYDLLNIGALRGFKINSIWKIPKASVKKYIDIVGIRN